MDEEKLLAILEGLSKSVKDLVSLVQSLTDRVNKLEQRPFQQPDIGRWPVGPGLVQQPEIKCQKCGMMWQGVMGYVCPRMDCEIQPKIIASSNNERL